MRRRRATMTMVIERIERALTGQRALKHHALNATHRRKFRQNPSSSPAKSSRVGSSPGRSLNMRGMFNPELGPVGKADVATRSACHDRPPTGPQPSLGKEEMEWAEPKGWLRFNARCFRPPATRAPSRRWEAASPALALRARTAIGSGFRDRAAPGRGARR